MCLNSEFRVVMSVAISDVFVRLNLQLFVGGFLSLYVCVFTNKWCPTHIVLCVCFIFLRLVYPTFCMLPVSLSLDCPVLIAPLVFSNVYRKNSEEHINNMLITYSFFIDFHLFTSSMTKH